MADTPPLVERMSDEAYAAMVACDKLTGTTLACDKSCPAYDECFLGSSANDSVFALFKAERAEIVRLKAKYGGDIR